MCMEMSCANKKCHISLNEVPGRLFLFIHFLTFHVNNFWTLHFTMSKSQILLEAVAEQLVVIAIVAVAAAVTVAVPAAAAAVVVAIANVIAQLQQKKQYQ